MFSQRIFLEIMNHFIHPQQACAGVEQLSPEDVRELLALGMEHSVYPIVFDAVRSSEAYAQLPEQMRTGCAARFRQLVIGQTARTSLFLGVYQRICMGGVTPLVVKGLVLRNLFEQGDFRASSDEDLLVRREDFFRLDELLRSQGFDAELGEHPLQEHEITYWHRRSGIHLEIHLSLFPEDSGAYGYLNGAFRDVFDRQITQTILGVEIHTLDWTDHMLYLICHGLKHFLHSGFGIRQICDMVKFAECCGDRIDWNRIEQWTREKNLYVFWQNLFDIGDRYLGFDREKACLERPADLKPDSEAMLADLMDSGIYGKRTADRVHSSNLTLQAAAGRRRSGNLTAALFPDFGYMKNKFPYLQRRRWLLPVAWGQRMVQYLRHTNRREISSTMDLGRHRVELLRQYGLVPDRKK